MNYKESLNYIFASLPMFHRQGASAYKKDLDNIIALTRALGNPEKNLRYIHVAGTNGKGSVSFMLAAVLQAQGYKTGLYISPHYRDFRERIRINGKVISKPYVCQFIEKHLSLFDTIQPSFFEMTLALAFDYFKQKNVDYVILETGLGGRLDSTNIVHPLLSIITNISFDHINLLGDSLEKIAFEKAGIIKSNVPVLIGRKQIELEHIFISKAKETQSQIFFADEICQISSSQNQFGLDIINYENGFVGDSFRSALKGPYQLENIRTVLAATAILNKLKLLTLENNSITKALEKTILEIGFMGRWQWVSTDGPYILADSAHNEDGIKYLFEELKKFPYEKLHIVCGFVNDKAIEKMLGLFPKMALYYFVKADIPRGLAAEELQNQANAIGLMGKKYVSVKAGLRAAKTRANKKDLVVIAGSIFVLAEIL